MSDTTDPLQKIVTLLDSEIRYAGELQETLVQEHRLLLKGDAESIQDITGIKQRQMQQLQQQIGLRNSFMQQHGLPGGKQGLEQLSALFPESRKIRDRIARLLQAAAEMKNQNEINGGLVALCHRHVQQAITLLTGQTAGWDTTYGPEGGHRKGVCGNTLAKA